MELKTVSIYDITDLLDFESSIIQKGRLIQSLTNDYNYDFGNIGSLKVFAKQIEPES